MDLHQSEDFLKFIFIKKVGALVLSEKSLITVTISYRNKHLKYIDTYFKEQLLKDVSEYPIDLSYVDTGRSIKYIIYNYKNMQKVLSNKEIQTYLKEKDLYRKNISFYIMYLQYHLKFNMCPVISGIFYGYPLVDIINFEKGNKFKCLFKKPGWQYSTNQKDSHRLYLEYLKAGDDFLELLS